MGARILVSRPGTDDLSEATAADLPALLAEDKTTVWVDLDGRGPDEEKILSETFGFHPLVIEDVFGDTAHPKIENYDDYLYVIVHGIDRDAEDPKKLETLELDLLIGKRYVVTHHRKPMRSVEGALADLKRNSKILHKGPAFLAHAILDHLTDHYLPVMDRFTEQIEELEAQVLKKPGPHCLDAVFSLRRSLQAIRRVSVHQKEALHRLARGEFALIPKPALPFFRDVYDHFVRVSDLTDSYRELISSALEAYMSVQSNRLNEVMKVLSLISTVMLPMTFIAGVYGMNFDHMPELHWRYGYAFAWLLMGGVGVSLYALFWFRRWL